MRKKLSVAIIAHNEENNIRRCLESVKWADEIVVIDSKSTDRTKDICLEYTNKVFYREFDDFSSQKNYALAKTSCEWVLSIDADEEIPLDLISEIKNKLENPDKDGYFIPRCNYVYGSFLKYAKNDYHLRLFCKSKGRFKGVVHESIELKGESGYMKKYFLHYTMPRISDHIYKINLYTDFDLIKLKDKKINRLNFLWYFVFRNIFEFLRHYILRGAYKDGLRGFIFCVNTISAEFLTYAKIWERQLRK